MKPIPVSWMTNLEFRSLRKQIELTKSYDPELYPVFDNAKAINVGKTRLIPKDYDGLMGVPISFLTFYDPVQFEIVAMDYELADPVLLPDGKTGTGRCYLNNKRLYARLIIRLRHEK